MPRRSNRSPPPPPGRLRSGYIRHRHLSALTGSPVPGDPQPTMEHHELPVQPSQDPEQPEGPMPGFSPQQFAAAISVHVSDGVTRGITDGLARIISAVVDRLAAGLSTIPPLGVAAEPEQRVRSPSTPSHLATGHPSGSPETNLPGRPAWLLQARAATYLQAGL